MRKMNCPIFPDATDGRSNPSPDAAEVKTIAAGHVGRNRKGSLRARIYGILREIYWRFVWFPTIHNILLRWWNIARDTLLGVTHSADNRRFRQASAARRSDSAAIGTAIPAPEPNEWPALDISIVTHNSARWLDGFFTSLVAQRYPLDKLSLHIVDNGSTDDTVSRIRAFIEKKRTAFADIILIEQGNIGFGAGHNRALRGGCCEYCLVTNVDLEFLSDSLCDVVRTALADVGGEVGSWELRQYPYEHPKHYDPVTLETAWSSHACILLRRSAFVKCGGYDPALFMYTEDVELSYRLRSHGYVLKYIPSAAVTHHAYETPGMAKPAQYVGGAFGNLYLRLRYGNSWDILIGLMLYVAFLVRPSPFSRAKRDLVKKLTSLFPRLLDLRRLKGSVRAFYPFWGLDYEMSRGGAYMAACPPQFPPGQAPRVSVLIRTFRGRGFLLAQALRSVFNQTWPYVELIVSEDGGDTQRKLVETMGAQAPAGITVRYLSNPKRGRSATGNSALKAATASYFLFLDDDDLLYADHIESLFRALLKHPECSVAYAPGLEVVTDVSLSEQKLSEVYLRNMKSLHRPWDYEALLNDNYILVSALAKRYLYEERGGFDQDLEIKEDWNLWLRYGYGNMFAYVPKMTMLYRTPGDPAVIARRGQGMHEAHEAAKARALAAIQDIKGKCAGGSVSACRTEP